MLFHCTFIIDGVITIRPCPVVFAETNWNSSSKERVPAGGSTWKAETSTGSRRQGILRPLAVITRPVMCSTWAAGWCLPGSQRG